MINRMIVHPGQLAFDLHHCTSQPVDLTGKAVHLDQYPDTELTRWRQKLTDRVFLAGILETAGNEDNSCQR